MKGKQETFKSLMDSFAYRYDLRTVFEDFLTMTMCASAPNPITGKSYYEDLYLETIAKYAKDELRYQFPKLYGSLYIEMEERLSSQFGNDVLGEFYEQNFCKRGSGQFFTPWHVCLFMAECLGDREAKNTGERLRILDPSCGSGRTLLAGARVFGNTNNYYGIDIDHTCVKMTAINLFFNGIFRGEVMCADALSPTDFRISYRLSFLPFGIFRIEKPEHSQLWQSKLSIFEQKRERKAAVKQKIILPSEEKTQMGNGSQLQLFKNNSKLLFNGINDTRA